MHAKTLIRLFLIDDHPYTSKSLGMLLESLGNINVVGYCEDGNEAVKKIQKLKPDIVLVDVHMPKIDGFDTTIEILKIHKNLPIIGISIDNNPENARTFLKIGAKGFVTKTSPPEEFMVAITEVLNGNNYVCKEISF